MSAASFHDPIGRRNCDCVTQMLKGVFRVRTVGHALSQQNFTPNSKVDGNADFKFIMLIAHL
jgi:hypothetical protein